MAQAKQNILLVGNYNREDYINLFAACRQYFNFFFLEFASKEEITNTYYKSYGQAIFWGDFKDTDELLRVINPHKVIFFFIESYFHVLLNMACKSKGITTYLMDHGLRDVSISSRLEKYINERKAPVAAKSYRSKFMQLPARAKARLFLKRTKAKLSKPEAEFFQVYASVRKNRTFWETFKLIKSHFRLPSAYIAFSPKAYEAHAYHDHPPENQKKYFIGLPGFDHLANTEPGKPNPRQAIFFDQGFACQNILGWSYDFYEAFIHNLTSICKRHNIHLYVKLHPLQSDRDEPLWLRYDNVSLVDNKQVTCLASTCGLIFGFCSTYLLPMIAHKHTTLLVFENHPAGKVDAAKSFIDAGVAHPIYNLPEELPKALENLEELHQQQVPNKVRFTEEWMYKFDGKSGERLRDILLSKQP